MRYVDGFVLPVPKKNLKAYRRMAQKAGKIWREHGALEYKECAGDDLNVKYGMPFPRQMKLKSGETVVFAYIVFKSREAAAYYTRPAPSAPRRAPSRGDRVIAKVMKDPRLANSMNEKTMPFDAKRMLYGGFTVLVDAQKTFATPLKNGSISI